MTIALSNPMTAHLQRLMAIDLSVEKPDRAPKPNQLAQIALWNSPSGIRAQAAAANCISPEEDRALRRAMDHWTKLSGAHRYDVNCVMTMLFYMRKRLGGRLTFFDRCRIEDFPQFRLREERPVRPRSEWRRSSRHTATHRASFVN